VPDLSLQLDAFIRSVGVSRTPHVLFLGAGASITSGMPSAQMCIWEWKRDIFLTNNVGLEAQFSELSLASIRQRIQRWLDQQAIYPVEADPDEYSVYIEACYPIPESRRAYFQEKVRLANPHIGYQLLSTLAENSLIKSVWTTNFDQLVGRALASSSVAPIEAGIDSAHRIIRASRRGELLVVSLHGDYRYDRLKNTTGEIKHQEEALEAGLVQELKDAPVIVCGYSGRDESIMSAFRRSMEQKGAGALYWCLQDLANVPTSVTDLINRARANGRTAYLVPAQGFDDLMVRLALRCLDTPVQAKAIELIAQNSGGSDAPRSPFRIDAADPTSILKSNAFEIECPSEVLACELKEWPKEHVWRWVREQTSSRNVIAVPFKGKVFALGTVDEVRACFGENIKEGPLRTPLAEDSLRFEDGAITALMLQALVSSMATATGTQADRSHEMWSQESPRRESYDAETYLAHQSVHLSLRQIEKKTFLTLKPSIRILDSSGQLVPKSKANPIKMRILGWQHNREFNEAVNFWRSKLLATDKPQKVYEFPSNSGSPFRFLIRRAPAFAEIAGVKDSKKIALEPRFRSLIKQKGFQIAEPALVFANRSGTGTARDPHPVRGILSNRPFDYPLTTQGFGNEIRLGVVCPKAETKLAQAFLVNVGRNIQPSQQEADYLPPFPGFKNAFGLDFAVADPDSRGWIVCPEPTGADDRAKAIEVGRNINRAIETLQASFSPNVVLIFFPDRWAHWRGFNSEAEHFDVHDYVKASSVQKGIGTQFLDQSTLSDNLQCRVWWWLSLAFYAKAMRTPWVLDDLDRDSAYVGLGMSYDPSQEQSKKVVMGCSHIYSSRGEGLQYRLSRVENPVFFGKNPFLSRDDARRVGEQIRELFFESRSVLPKRVVIHKRTRFTKDEQLGLKEGLSGVSQIEMLEIVIDDALRYIASSVDSRGILHEDNYPVSRGSVVRIDDYTALVWVHGVTTAVSDNRRYYQGKRRIPAPLTVRRHCGHSDIRQLSTEILGLSKMNWNTFDLYTKLPATVQSSNEIARIGSLLGSFQPRAYDFRLFI
jgi:SIR2-like protein